MSFPVRLRHPRGVTTLTLDPSTTYDALQSLVFSATEIPLDAQDLKYGYPPKPIPANTSKVSSIPITRGEQIIVTERPPPQRASRASPARPPAPLDTAHHHHHHHHQQQPDPDTQGNVFETAPTPKSTISTATHTPTPAPSVPRTFIPSPYASAYPGTGPASAASTTTHPPPSLRVPPPAAAAATKPALGSGGSPLALAERPSSSSARTPRHVSALAGTAHGASSTGGIVVVEETPASVPLPEGASLVHRIVPDDNSCLFSAVGLVCKGGYDDTVVRELRNVVADEIRKDPTTYSDVILGRPREEYIDLITRPSTWGGAIELAIFAKHFKTEIASWDVMTGRADRFGEGEYENRCILIYSGIHYDAATSSPTPDAPPDFHTSIFPVADAHILTAAAELVKKLREKHYYTDTQNFDLRCQVCQIGLKGEQGAREHAIKTGHVEFGEY